MALGADAFTTHSTQHADQDGDGYGDAADGFQPDACPMIEGNSSEDVFGCLDSDGDGWSDAIDAFPNDATQHLDADQDGYGDSITGNLPDACPGLFGLSSEQRLGCPDTDGDGWDDDLDIFPSDERFWSDSDEDGYPDQNGTNMSDDCPEVAGTSQQDRIGCPDGDGDGWSDEADAFPLDASRHLATKDSSFPTTFILVAFGVVFMVLVGLALMSRRSASNALNSPPLVNAPVQFTTPVVPSTPPLPPEGLPAGWTMDQWAWYGEDYLKNR